MTKSAGVVIRHPGGIFTLPPNVPVVVPPYGEFLASCTRRVRHAWLHFDVPIPSPEDVRALVPAPMALAQSGDWSRLFTALPITADTPASMQLTCQSLLCSAVVEACTAGEARWTPATPAVAQARRRVEPALRHIEANIARLLDGQGLATLCSMTRSHFVRLFRLATGQSPARYLAERRIHRIAGQLALSDLTIERLAADFGFADRYHFTRVFTRVMRVAPAAYRRASRG